MNKNKDKKYEKQYKNKKYKKHKYYYYNKDYFSPNKFNDILSKLNPQFSKFESNDSKDLLLYLFQTLHSELNFFGDKRLNDIPKFNQMNESESFNFFMIVHNNLNLSIFSYLFYGIFKLSNF